MIKAIFALLIILASYSNSLAAPEDCDRDIDFNNNATYKNVSGKIRCLDNYSKALTREVELKNGDIIKDARYNSKGVKLFEESMQNGKRNGINKNYYDPSGNLKSETNYKDDCEVGFSTDYYDDGKTISGKKYTDPKSFEESTVSYNKSGTVKNIGCGKTYPPEFAEFCTKPVQLYSESGKTGMYVSPHANYSGVLKAEDGKGNAAGEVSLVNGKKEGREEILDKDGNPTKVSEYKNGKVAKETIYYRGTKQVKSIVTVEAATGRDTRIEEFYQNGSPKRSKIATSDNLFEIKSYYDNGKLAAEGIYKEEADCQVYYACDDKVVGEAKYYHDNEGWLEKVVTFDKDMNIAKSVKYDKTGKVLESKEYFPDGSEKR